MEKENLNKLSSEELNQVTGGEETEEYKYSFKQFDRINDAIKGNYIKVEEDVKTNDPSTRVKVTYHTKEEIAKVIFGDYTTRTVLQLSNLYQTYGGKLG